MDILKIENIKNLIITIKNQQILVDSDVARLYDMETKDINRVAKNSPDKFLSGYIFRVLTS